jgi:hypothetical protein
MLMCWFKTEVGNDGRQYCDQIEDNTFMCGIANSHLIAFNVITKV